MSEKRFSVGSGYSSSNTVELISGGSTYFDLLEKLIDQAHETIHLQVYIYEADETGERITDALVRAALRSVKVYAARWIRVPKAFPCYVG